MQPENKLQFDKACQVMGLDPEARAIAWKRMTDLGLPPSDPTNVLLAVSGLLEKAADTLPTAIRAIPEVIEEASRRAVGPVAAAATAQVEAAHAKLNASVGASVAAAAVGHLKEIEKTRKLDASVSLVFIGTVTALVCVFCGWIIGNMYVNGLSPQWAAVAVRSDSTAWLRLIQNNPDLKNTIKEFCNPNTRFYGVVNGTRACSLPVWLDMPSATNEIRMTYNTLAEWLASWNVYILVSTSFVAGLIGAKAVRSVTAVKPIRWLLK